MKHFVVAINSPTSEQREAVVGYFKDSSRFGFWHWMPDFWLVYTNNPAITSAAIRDEIQVLAPGLIFAVFCVIPNQDWATYSDPKWADWLNQNWKVQ
jgi:hypothetical protein